MDKAKLIADIRHLLDEQELVSDIPMYEEDALPISDRIEALWKGAYNLAERIMPLQWVTWQDAENYKLIDMPQSGTGRIELPDNFLRLVELKMAGWRRSVSHAISENDPAYLLQHNAAMRGGIVNPVVAIVASGKALEYYSLPRSSRKHEIEVFRYVAEAGALETTEISEKGYKLFCLILARDVAMSMNRDTKSYDERIKIELQ